ncbi:MAG: hypothetical protein GY792_05600 [Gammaproteobacteria bacterium]|nr:hypothetical protein [Gammaproteobacteria bacterium]
MSKNGHSPEGLFSLGQICATPGALEALAPHEGLGLLLLVRHVTGDWGDVCEEDAEENELSIEAGFRILSSYTTPGNKKIWIITEADRSVTTLLLPSEY